IVAGGNYGWRVFEGTQCTGNGDPDDCQSPPFVHVPPIAEYAHADGRCSITGGYVYRGSQGTLPAGTYVFADFCTGEIFTLLGGIVTLLLDTSQNIASFGEDQDGELYVVGLGGTIHRLASGASDCAYAITPAERAFTAGSGTGSVTVTAGAGCQWTATDSMSWISINSGATGTGNGTVTYAVTTNTSTAPRTGTLTVAGQTHTVTQAAATPNCHYSLSASSRRFPAAGGTGTVTVSVSSGCPWTAVSTVTWITIATGASGNGTGTVHFAVGANGGGSRSGKIAIAGKSTDIRQRGASASKGSRR
ncbi:MAG TPA: BACON domain-containing protein, partial [Gemmatimonadales bacterium]|nr:BACON domain-containing protein [Gemmatimonadales bacterium]